MGYMCIYFKKLINLLFIYILGDTRSCDVAGLLCLTENFGNWLFERIYETEELKKKKIYVNL